MSETKTAVRIGDRIANGATVIAEAPSKTHHGAVVFLALWRDELVTWVGMPDGTGTTWGHYFGSKLADALADFHERAGIVA